jgi:signal transduction histidine kinase
VEPDLSLREIVETAVQYTQPLLHDKPVELTQDIPHDLPSITGDRKRLLQVVLNILSNACKFTEQGRIEVRVRQNESGYLLTIADSGPGIAPEDRAHVFTAFKQTDSGLRQGGGTGLGMPITQKLVEAHHGNIWFESEVGKGTTFFVELPRVAQPHAEQEGR